MKEEIAAAVFFVARLVKRYGCLDNDGRERFAAALTSVLFESYKNHWHPNAPTRGQAYRSATSFLLSALPACWVYWEESASPVVGHQQGVETSWTCWSPPDLMSCTFCLWIFPSALCLSHNFKMLILLLLYFDV